MTRGRSDADRCRTQRTGARAAARHDRRRRCARLGLAASALALALALVPWGPAWLSENAAASTPEPSETASSEPSSSPEPSLVEPTCSVSPSTPCCETSLGVYEFPTEGPWASAAPPWVDLSAGAGCAQLVATLELPEPTESSEPTESPSAEPLPTRAQVTELNSKLEQLNEQAVGTRELFLYSAGLLIFFLAIIAWRSRR